MLKHRILPGICPVLFVQRRRSARNSQGRKKVFLHLGLGSSGGINDLFFDASEGFQCFPRGNDVGWTILEENLEEL